MDDTNSNVKLMDRGLFKKEKEMINKCCICNCDLIFSRMRVVYENDWYCFECYINKKES